MYCMECGNKISEDAKFCDKCGHDQIFSLSSDKESGKKIDLPEKHMTKQINIVYANLVLILLSMFIPYASIQVTLFGEGKKEFAISAMEPIFIFYSILLVLTALFCYKKSYSYAMATSALMVLLSIFRIISIYSIEAGFGTKITYYGSSLSAPAALSTLCVYYLYLCFATRKSKGVSM